MPADLVVEKKSTLISLSLNKICLYSIMSPKSRSALGLTNPSGVKVAKRSSRLPYTVGAAPQNIYNGNNFGGSQQPQLQQPPLPQQSTQTRFALSINTK